MRYNFNFPVINFPFLSSNIPLTPANGVYVSRDSVANIKTLLIEESCLPINWCHRVTTDRSLCQQLKSSMRGIMTSLIPLMWPFLNLFPI